MAINNRKGRKHKRNERTKTVQPGNYLIVTEGTETEVNYFKNIKHLFSNSIIVEKIELDIQGTARSTKVLVNEAIKKRSLKSYSDVWVIFNKDDNQDFDEAIKRSNSLIEYHQFNKIFSPNKMNPATKVQDLVEELIKYISK